MLMDTIDRALPLQQQIIGELKAEIFDGLWVGRKDFYTEKEIADRFDVSLITSRAVLAKLADEGFLSRARGRRSIPLDPPPMPVETVYAPLVMSPGRTFGYSLHSSAVSIAPLEACRVFGLPPGSELWQCIRIRTLKGKVHSVAHNVQMPETGLRHSRSDLSGRPMFELLRAQGEKLSTLKRRISAVAPPQSLAALLDMKIGTPTLLYTCTLHRGDDSVIEWVRIYLKPGVVPGTESFDLDQSRWVSLNLP